MRSQSKPNPVDGSWEQMMRPRRIHHWSFGNKLVLIWLGLGVVGWSFGLGTSSQGQTVIDSPKLFRITLCRSLPEHIDALGE